jgi:hypothetical protein
LVLLHGLTHGHLRHSLPQRLLLLLLLCHRASAAGAATGTHGTTRLPAE